MIKQILLQIESAPSNKSEVVIAVVAVIFVGIIAYLISIDRKLKKLENKK